MRDVRLFYPKERHATRTHRTQNTYAQTQRHPTDTGCPHARTHICDPGTPPLVGPAVLKGSISGGERDRRTGGAICGHAAKARGTRLEGTDCHATGREHLPLHIMHAPRRTPNIHLISACVVRAPAPNNPNPKQKETENCHARRVRDALLLLREATTVLSSKVTDALPVGVGLGWPGSG
jgi:hypothetical protein